MSIVKVQGGDAVTMTSLELVDFINSQREEGQAVLDHADLMKKVPKVLKKDAGRFSDIYLDSMNRRQKCYRFPKRETCLMAMSYSYELQAAVFDHMTDLEQKLAQQNAFALPRTRAEALRLAADLEEQNGVLVLENQQQAKKIEALENLFMPGETVPQFAKRLNGVNSQLILAFLLEQKWIFNAERDPDRSIKYRVYYLARDNHWLTEKPVTVSGEGVKSFIRYAPVMLEQGTKKLFDLYMAGKLPMKQSWNGQFHYEKFTPEKPL